MPLAEDVNVWPRVMTCRTNVAGTLMTYRRVGGEDLKVAASLTADKTEWWLIQTVRDDRGNKDEEAEKEEE